MNRLSNVTFDSKYIYAEDADGHKLKQSILWYPALKNASQEQQKNYTVGPTGFHWRELDENISFESFEYEDAVPTKVQEFFLTHKEINVAEFAKRIGINATLLRNYINGFKKPSAARESQIIDAIHQLGAEYLSYATADGHSADGHTADGHTADGSTGDGRAVQYNIGVDKPKYLSDGDCPQYSPEKI